MAKIDFEKIEFSKDNTITYEGETITIRGYVPMEEKLNAISTILSLSLNSDTGLYLPGHIDVYKEIFILKLYTDIEFTDEDIDNPMPVYDKIIVAPFYRQIIEILRANGDLQIFLQLLEENIRKLETYQTSAYGILDSLKKDYKNLDFDIGALQEKIQNKEGLELVDEVVKKLG